MKLCDLPDDVLTRVFRLARIYAPSEGKFARNLPLLAISQRLRRLALPVVYRATYCFVYLDGSVQRRNGALVPVDTTMDLIEAVGCVDLVRVVSLAVVCNEETPSAFQHVLQEVRRHTRCWPKVKQLTVNSVIREPGFTVVADILPPDRRSVRDSAEGLLSLYPGVERLRVYGARDGGVPNLYFAHLADHYAERLVEFRCDNSVSLSQDTQFPLVRVAHVTCKEGSGNSFPRLNPKTLEVLFLNYAPPSLDLGACGASDGSPDIVFPKLKKLHLLYHGDDGDNNNNMQATRQDGRPWRFHFPQLRDIVVTCRWSRCPHLENAVFPAAMESFKITSNATLLTTIAAKPLPTTQYLRVQVAKNPDNTPGVFAAINTIMSGMRPCKEVTLDIADEDLLVLPEDITFAGLTHLIIASPTSMRTVTELVQKLQQLTYLGIKNYTIHDIPPEVAVPAPDQPELLPPLDTRVEMLRLHRYWWGPCSKQDSRVWRYMLLRMPSLTSVYLTGVSREMFRDFVDDYSERYPHLSSIRMLNT